MAALEIGYFQRNQVGMPGREFGGPDLMVRAGRVGVFPNVVDIERMLDRSRPHFLSEQPLQQVLIQRQRALREDRITQLLKLVHDLVIQTGIMMIGPSQHHNADAIFALQLIHGFPGLPLDALFIVFERFEAGLNRSFVFSPGNPKYRLPRLEQLISQQLSIGEVEDRAHIRNAGIGKDVVFLRVGSFHCLGGGCDRGTGIDPRKVYQRRMEHIDHGEENHV